MKDAYFASDNVTVSIRDENAPSASNRFKQPHILSSTMPKDASPQGEEHLTKDVAETLITLRRGGTILYPTDTIWGIGCDAANATAIASIYRIKRRAVSKSLIVLVSDLTMLARYVGIRKRRETNHRNLPFRQRPGRGCSIERWERWDTHSEASILRGAYQGIRWSYSLYFGQYFRARTARRRSGKRGRGDSQ